MPAARKVVCATYNGKLARGRTAALARGEPTDDLTAWLTLDTGGRKGGEGDAAPDFVAVGFQEMIPLHLALAGFTKTAIDLHDDELRNAIDTRYASSEKAGEGYRLVARNAIGGIVLLVYARAPAVSQRVVSVQSATIGCGVLGVMGNKGAVGIRVVLAEDEGESVWTFVSAHLAAHQNQVEARNSDWKEIVSRLVFAGADGRESQLFETGHLFFFGDLNYRISLTSPKKLAPHLLAHSISSLSPSDPSSCTSLLAQDQLQQEQSAGRTLHHLREGPITFQPTYKFLPGSRDKYKDFRKRPPGWCDRVLFASSAGDKAEVLDYHSVMDFTRSDHKPVAATISIPSSSLTRPLPRAAPFPLERSYRLKHTVGRALDRLVGVVWCLVMLAGFNRDARIGIANLAIAAATAYYRRVLFG
ncbi:phosphoinositide 5-phosphatase INP54 [Rhodotorula paludigena]|uniref:phosphoinositide 5-phosphatase INP54 n=1 Tax=Rhodotorula paludigena TaxID=86838 RepID=UPI003180EC06